MRKSTIPIVFLFMLLTSCLKVKTDIPCADFNININNVSTGNMLFLSRLSKNLKNKLQLVKNKNSNNLCNVDINFSSSAYSAIIDESGYTGRKNFKLEFDYTINIKNVEPIKRKNIVIFYGANISDNYYSEYVYSQKREDNNLSMLTEKLFYYIVKDLKNVR